MFASLRRCIDLLSPRQRREWLLLLPASVLGALLEAGGAASVFLLIRLVADPAAVASLPMVPKILAQLPWQGPRATVLEFAALVAVYYIVKNTFLAVLLYAQNRVVATSMADVANRLLRAYLSAPYSFHLRHNSTQLSQNVLSATEMAFRGLLSPALTIAGEILVVGAILGVLVLTAPAVTFAAAGFLVVFILGVMRATQRTAKRWGTEVVELRGYVQQTIYQAFGGMKEARVLGREGFFVDAFARRHDLFSHLLHLQATLNTLPRLLIETVFTTGTLLLITLFVLRSPNSAAMVPLLGLFAYAGFRVIPSGNRITASLTTMRFAAPAVDRLYADYDLLHDPIADWHAVPPPLSFRDRIEIDRISYVYEGTEREVLKDVSLTIRRGESIGIVGPTGAGKSTLIDVLLGLLPPASGCITVDGVDVRKVLRSWQRSIGYVPQSIYLTDDSLRRNIAFGIDDDAIDARKIDNAVRMAQLDDVMAVLPQGLDTQVGERGVRLSGGQRQRVAIARALYHEPELLVLDEATAALDNQTEREVTRAIRAIHGKKTVVIIAHRLSTVRDCDRLIFLQAGRLAAAGTFDDLLRDSDAFRAMATELEKDTAA